jgi:Fe-S cluster assembly iron-binding protein IscA
MIEITDEVKSKIREILAKNPGKYLRLVVEGDGCAGPYLGLSLDEPNSNETITRVNGIDLLISPEAQRYAAVTTINIFVNPAGKDFL